MSHEAPDASPRTEWLPTTSGQVSGILGIACGGFVAAITLTQWTPDGGPFLLCVGFLIALGGWAIMLRPRVGLTPRDLVLRGMLSTVRVPLASIEGVVVRQMLAVRAGERRFHSPALGRSRRALTRAARPARTDRAARGGAGLWFLGGFRPTEVPEPTSRHAHADIDVTDVVMGRIEKAVGEAKARHQPDGPARREWALPELVGLALGVIGAIVALLV